MAAPSAILLPPTRALTSAYSKEPHSRDGLTLAPLFLGLPRVPGSRPGGSRQNVQPDLALVTMCTRFAPSPSASAPAFSSRMSLRAGTARK